jgi:hypothetical protein
MQSFSVSGGPSRMYAAILRIPRNIRLGLTCCALLFAGCSVTRLGYDHLDTLLRWQVGDYVSLDGRQKRDFDAEVRAVWTWHRRTQLPLYAAEFRRLAAQVQAGPVDRARLEALTDTIENWWIDLAGQAAPGFARLNADLDDAQVAEQLRNIGKEAERRARKRLRHNEREQRQYLVDDMDERLEQWIGTVDAAQERLLREWADGVPLPTPEQLQQRRARLDRYAALLAGRAQPGFEQRMRDYLAQPPGDAAEQAQERAERLRWLQLLADISTTLQPRQREHLIKRLLGYAEDFEALAAEKLPPAPAAIP